MPGIETFLIATVLAWGWTGLDMSLSRSVPAYVISGGRWTKSSASAYLHYLFWPFQAYSRGELGWFVASFLSYSVVLFGVFAATNDLMPWFLCLPLIVLLRHLPIIQLIFIVPLTLLATIFWLTLIVPFGSKVPDFVRRQEL